MLRTFELLTKNISEEEIEMAKQIAININAKCLGKENAVTAKRLRDALLKRDGIAISGPRIRKMINYIRANNLVPCLCASKTGYFKAIKESEWDDWKKSMQQRINEQQAILDAGIHFNDGKETL